MLAALLRASLGAMRFVMRAGHICDCMRLLPHDTLGIHSVRAARHDGDGLSLQREGRYQQAQHVVNESSHVGQMVLQQFK